MALKKFDDDDNPYLEWMHNNPSSFVVNAWRAKNSDYFVLRKSMCPHISATAGLEKGAYTEKQTIKVVSDDLNELKDWFKRNYTKFKGEFDECKTCHPSMEGRISRSLVLFPETIEDDKEILVEGAKKQVTVNAYERNLKARKECLNHYGYICKVCDIDFESVYGRIGRGFIHVHHLKEISEIKKTYIIDPIADLRPVCPNCHSMLHQRKKPCYSIEELQLIIIENKGKGG